MTNNANKPERRPLRLKGYDYSQAGAYFVTICTRARMPFFEDETIRTIVERCWLEIPDHHPMVQLDEWVIMPNHLHAIVVLADDRVHDCRGEVTSPNREGAETAPLRKRTLGQVVAYFKYQTAKAINQARSTPGASVWQRNYYEHVIRNEDDLTQIRQYILDNPVQWDRDEENPDRKTNDARTAR
jgi:REP element-mobilizing transposase RayT